MVDQIRIDTGSITDPCLVAIFNNEIIGYILLPKALIHKNQGLVLGSLEVNHSYQRKRIEKKLIDYGLIEAKEHRFEWVELTGGDYYTQYGFESAFKYGIVLGYNHLENAYLKIKFLNTTNRETSSNIRCCDYFYDENVELL